MNVICIYDNDKNKVKNEKNYKFCTNFAQFADFVQYTGFCACRIAEFHGPWLQCVL